MSEGIILHVNNVYLWSNPFAMLRGTLIRILNWFVVTRRGRVIHLLSLPWLVLLAWLTSVAWFLTDDAFISFRYVRNLLEGHGLVFNPGEYVEGYTNFLWILELAALWGLFGVRPEHAAPWLSIAYTVGTLVALWWWLARSPSRHDRGLVAWMALGLLCSSATFAVWTVGGGLETRQFTCFVVVAVVCLAVHRRNRRGLLVASVCLAAATLTRPEGLLLAACCFGWFAAQRIIVDRAPPRSPGRNDSFAATLAVVVRRLDWRELTYLIAPFAVLVAAHFLWRYGYYGEWLPNTYYAKHVRPWYESGFRYLWAATLETGLYLLLPLAWVALRERWRRDRDGTYALVLLCIGTHLYYLLRIGGDHFEYRPLDFYWPLLALPAAEGIAHLGARVAASLRRKRALVRGRGVDYPRAWAVVLFVPVLFYASAIQGVLLFEGPVLFRSAPELDEEHHRWLFAAPGMPALVAISNNLNQQSVRQLVGSRITTSREDSNKRIREWQPYEEALRGIIPDDALMSRGDIGIPPYYVPNLTIIDYHGLADTTVAHNPVTSPNYERTIAHDRRPPPGYLQQRGINFHLYAAATSEVAVPAAANYTLQVGPSLWMPFDVADHQWANERFAGRNLRARNRFSLTDPAGNRFRVGDRHYVGAQFLGRFEGGLDDWLVVGAAITNHGQHGFYQDQLPIFGHVGPGFLTSYHPNKGDKVTGWARSPEFTAADGHHLALLVGGGSGTNVGVRLLADGQEVTTWSWSERFPGSTSHVQHFKLIVHPLAGVVGQPLQLELFDNDPAGHIMLDHVLLVREVGTSTAVTGTRPEVG